MEKCKNCVHWNNKQSELDYDKFYGICTSYKLKFNTSSNSDDCVVLDRDAISDAYMGVRRFENQNNEIPFGKANKSAYCFVTGENFGCINFMKK